MDKCKDKNCTLKDIKYDEYVIISGDDIDEKSSVDCIIFNLELMDGGYDIILCELTRGKKKLGKAKEKFLNSGTFVVDLMNKIDCDINNIHCLLLGKLKMNGKVISKNHLIERPNFINIPTFYRNDVQIRNGDCGYSINDLYEN